MRCKFFRTMQGASFVRNSENVDQRAHRLRRRLRRRHKARVGTPQITRVVLAVVVSCVLLGGGLAQNCCSGPDAEFECVESGVDHLGERYYCMHVESPQTRACVSCIPSRSSSTKCAYCCGTPNAECDLEWSWGAVLATLSVSAVFATCSGILALAEKRRKRKGISLARAWSIPQGMPVLRATVTDLSDAVRGRASIWSAEGLDGADVGDDDLLEHVGLLEEIPNDSIYGALVQQRDSDIPVAKLAEDNWVTAMAFAGGQPNPESDPVTYGSTSTTAASTSRHEGGGPEGQEEDEQSWSVSRWRSARAAARQARRLNSSSGGSRSGRAGDGVVSPADATTAAYISTPAAGPPPSGGVGAAGGRASRWEPPPPAVVVGYDPETPGGR
ncbi:unnamed protein product [Ectocarpus sp. 12 AP-2014]